MADCQVIIISVHAGRAVPGAALTGPVHGGDPLRAAAGDRPRCWLRSAMPSRDGVQQRYGKSQFDLRTARIRRGRETYFGRIARILCFIERIDVPCARIKPPAKTSQFCPVEKNPSSSDVQNDNLSFHFSSSIRSMCPSFASISLQIKSALYDNNMSVLHSEDSHVVQYVPLWMPERAFSFLVCRL